MISPAVVRMTYVVPALQKLGLYSQNAEYLLMGTAAIESDFINFVQIGGGPARGMFQMEQVTYLDIVNRYLALPGNKTFRDTAFAMALTNPPSFLELSGNHLFSAALARIKYRMISASIPSTLTDQAQYWWTHYNGQSPNGLKPGDYLSRWRRYCAPLYPGFK